jgi:DNA-binding transcriptional regulator GbsR (MarR family)
VPDDPGSATGPEDPLLGYIERFAAVLVGAGFPPMPARVLVALLITDTGRMTAAELAGRLRISPAAVSGAVRYLIQVGLVHKERVPGSRRDYYRMPANMWDDLLRMRDQVMSRWASLVREGIDLVGPDTPAGRRLAEQAAFLEFVSQELGEVIARWEKYRREHLATPSGETQEGPEARAVPGLSALPAGEHGGHAGLVE